MAGTMAKNSNDLKNEPTHCTGDKQISIFKEMFGTDFIGIGTGKKLIITDQGII
jgi:metal-dependent hydrolase (beta-lactamase superfamily II)